MSDELLNCPMCGSKAELNIDCDVYVSCTKCGVSGSHRAATTGSADTYQILPVEEVNDKARKSIDEWNIRTVDIEMGAKAIYEVANELSQSKVPIHWDKLEASYWKQLYIDRAKACAAAWHLTPTKGN